MKLSEIIAAVGDENVKVQNLMASITRWTEHPKKKVCSITFDSEQGLFSDGKHTALIVWIPKDKILKEVL